MRILIRVDASVDIGGGHFMRCFMLAQALKIEGIEITFASISLPEYFLRELQNNEFHYLNLSKGEDKYLHINEVFDAKQIASFSRFQIWDWIIVDHYSLSSIWEKAVRPIAKKIFVIDDLANRKHVCDLLLDQNYEDSSRYSSLVNKDCVVLLGSKYALLNPKLLKYKKTLQKKIIRRVLIYFGATDSKNLTAKVLHVLSTNEFQDLDIDIVYGIHYQFLDDLKRMAIARGRTVLHGPQPHLGKLMRHADLAIGAGGVSNWERLCIGLPSVVIAIAQNQVPISKILGEIGLIKYLGEGDEISEFDMSIALEKLCLENYLAASQKACQRLCDGLGITRVVDRVMMLNNSVG